LLYQTDLGILLFNRVPLTEMIWFFSWGLAIGPFYEFAMGYVLVKTNEKKSRSVK
jgi:hypothetical protein